LLIDANFLNALINKGNSFCHLKKYDKAMNCYDKALEIDYKNFNALNNKGYAFMTIGDFIKAQKYFDKALKIEPENPLVLYNKGLFYEKKAEYKEALKWYNKLLKIKPNHTNALNAKGRILNEIDKEDEAILVFDQVLDVNPTNTDGLTNKGVYLIKHAQKEKDFEEALRYFDKVLSINPEHFEALNNKVFQNHAVSICEDGNGNFISEEEAHYICAILNVPIVEKYIIQSSDSRSFKIRPPIKIPKYNSENPKHIELATLSKNLHEDQTQIDIILKRIQSLYLEII
jgi:tetratricopeptide (TPR) repeat protein